MPQVTGLLQINGLDPQMKGLLGRRRSTNIKHHPGVPVLFYRAALPLSRQTLTL
jgi:hypothetical protein